MQLGKAGEHTPRPSSDPAEPGAIPSLLFDSLAMLLEVLCPLSVEVLCQTKLLLELLGRTLLCSEALLSHIDALP
ncbi:GL10257 [Drosophila persimilis]|uniref:GL10257 n=1 Tax=Drosophila persimilis TaxID=7234 RepID=B4HDA2_DROPE|nr:GL10257 [Drosophila persimilis]